MKRGISTRGRGKKLVHNISFRGTLNSKPKYAALLFLCFLVFLSAMPSGAMGGTLTVTKNGTGTGTVTSNDGYINCGATCSHSYGLSAPTVILTATPDVSSNFASWSGCTSTNGNQCTINVGLLGTTTVTATFNIKTFTVTANAGGNGTGSVTSNTGGINYNYPAASTGTTCAINYGTNVVLTASSGTGSTTSWADCAGAGGTAAGNGTSTATCTFSSLTANKTATATFTLKTYAVTANGAGNGSGMITGNLSGDSINATWNGSTLTGDNTATVNYGSGPYTVTASANTGSTVAWTSGCNSTSGNGTTSATCTLSSPITVAKNITATFTLNQYTVTPAAGAGGTINPSTPQAVNYNQTTSFTVSPNAGYHITSVGGTCGGNLVGTTYTTSPITADCTVVANFTIDTHTVTASAGANGSISPSGAVSVNHGATQAFTVTPSANYHAVMSGTCGGNLVGTTYTTNAITSDCTVIANFTIDTHTVTASAGANGSISPSGAVSVNHGATQAFTVTPSANYHAVMSGTCGGNLVGTTYTTNAITADCTVVANFVINTLTHIITVSSGANGNISPSGAVSVGDQGSQIFNITANTNYHITDVLVDNSSVGVVATYAFNNVTTDHTISASFALNRVDLPYGLYIIFSQVADFCTSSASIVGNSYGSAPSGYKFLGKFYDITTCADYNGTISVTIPYTQSSIPSGKEGTLRMFHWENGAWHDVTVSVDTGNNTITGRVTSLSPFGMGYSTASSGGSGSGSGSAYSTGANENMIALIAILAISVGVFLIRKKTWN